MEKVISCSEVGLHTNTPCKQKGEILSVKLGFIQSKTVSL